MLKVSLRFIMIITALGLNTTRFTCQQQQQSEQRQWRDIRLSSPPYTDKYPTYKTHGAWLHGTGFLRGM